MWIGRRWPMAALAWWWVPSRASEHHNLSHVSLWLDDDAEIWGTTAPEYVSFTIDWWAEADDSAWPNGTSLATVHKTLSAPRLLSLARGLAPSFIRIGGSKADTIHYVGFENHTHGHTAQADEKLDSFCKEYPYRCLTPDKLDAILQFVMDSNSRLVFCLNYLGHTTRVGGRVNGKADRANWNSHEARSLLQYTAKWQQTHGTDLLYGVELGNEVTHRSKAQNLTRYRLAYETLQQVLHEVWPQRNSRPLLMGPASAGTNALEPLARALTGVVEAFTYHKYHGRGGDPNLAQEASQPTFLEHPGHFHTHARTVARHMGDSAPALWVGEGALAYNSGRPNVTDSWISSMWYANVLGILARTMPLSHSVHCRQALVGGNYGLIDYAEGRLVPNPDYWIAYVWTALVDRVAVGPLYTSALLPYDQHDTKLQRHLSWNCCEKSPLESPLRAHAFCARSGGRTLPGDVVVVIIHLSNTEFALDFSSQRNMTSRSEFLITAHAQNDPLASRHVTLNGILLAVKDDALPDIWDASVSRPSSDTVKIAPFSVSFIVLHGIQSRPCLDSVFLANDIRHSSTVDETNYSSSSTPLALPNNRESGGGLFSQLVLQVVGAAGIVCWICFRPLRQKKSRPVQR